MCFQLIRLLSAVFPPPGFDAAKQADALYKEFGPGTIYEKVRQQSGQPKDGPWTNHSIKIFIANREEGRKPEADPTSKDPDGLCKSVVVIGQYSGQSNVLDKVAECVGVTQVGVVSASEGVASHDERV